MTYPNTCGFAPVDFHLPQTILEHTLVLNSKPIDSIFNNCRGFAKDLEVINVETDCYLLSLDHLIGHAPILPVDLVHSSQTYCSTCCKPPSYIPYKGTYVPYDGTFGAPDQGQMLDL
jgi:hypothetical protein